MRYTVRQLTHDTSGKVDWSTIEPLSLKHFMGSRPEHFPEVELRMVYNSIALYMFFLVRDNFVRARVTDYQGPVCTDSCVEFFFTPGSDILQGYFNLEVNCGGTALFCHQRSRGREVVPVSAADFAAVRIVHSMPKMVEPEIAGPATWTLEYCLPFAILGNYTEVAIPAPGVRWRANFYKCADQCSHPHWLTWAPVESAKPDFHRPEYFGELVFG